MPHQVSTWLGSAVVLCVCLSALRLGGRPERAIASLILLQLVWSNVTHKPVTNSDQYGAFYGDIVLFASLSIAMLLTQRRWTIWATAFQLLAVCTHVVRRIDLNLRGWAYMTSAILFGYFVLVALALGIVEARRAPVIRQHTG